MGDDEKNAIDYIDFWIQGGVGYRCLARDFAEHSIQELIEDGIATPIRTLFKNGRLPFVYLKMELTPEEVRRRRYIPPVEVLEYCGSTKRVKIQYVDTVIIADIPAEADGVTLHGVYFPIPKES